MKTISFNSLEVLPSLSDKTKTQTTRPAWKGWRKVMPLNLKMVKLTKEEADEIMKETSEQLIPEPPGFKVGDKVKIYWKQKLIGIVKITDVFEVEMEIRQGSDEKLGSAILYYYPIRLLKIGGKEYECSQDQWDNELEKFAKRNGFKSAENMFEWFDKEYNLSEPKPFWVYRWKWVR